MIFPRVAQSSRKTFALAGVSLLSLIVAAVPVHADTTVSTDTTAPLTTSTAGNVTVTKDGSIKPGSATAITVNSNANVSVGADTDNGDYGTMKVEDGNNLGAISVLSGTNATISNAGHISVVESYSAADDDANGIADNQIASGQGRFGILVGNGGTSSGSINHSGTIYVEGQNSYGIGVLSNYSGNITTSGTISVVGENSSGIALKSVDGQVFLRGSVNVVGEGSSALTVNGDLTKTLVIQAGLAQGVSYSSDDNGTLRLPRRSLRVGASAVAIDGNMAGGILLATRPPENDSDKDDEDGDGIKDSEEGTGVITGYGNGPALQIGGAGDMTVGAATGQVGTYSLAIDGSVQGNSYYSATDATAIRIGGLGGNVTFTDGIGISGSVSATTYDQSAVGIEVMAGSTVNKLYNSGSIGAQISSPGDGSAITILDHSGTLTTIENTGHITVSGSSEDVRRAIDLSANTSGVAINQYMNADDLETRQDYLDDNDVTTDPTVYTSITGDIVTGSGNDTLSASGGKINSNTYFNGGNDTLTLSGDVVYTGKVFFGTGQAIANMSDTSEFWGTMDFGGTAGTLTLADTALYKGTFTNASSATVNVGNGSTLGAQKVEDITFGTLNVASGGTLNVYVDSSAGTSSHYFVNSASFASGAKLSTTISDLQGAEGTYTVLTAGTLIGSPSFDATTTQLPYIFNGSVNSTSNEIKLTIQRKTATELGLSNSGSAAWNAIFDAAGGDSAVSKSILEIEDSGTLQTQVNQLLPDHVGDVFAAVTTASRLSQRHITDENSTFKRFDEYDMQMWLEPIYWRDRQDKGADVGYHVNGWGLSGGAEWTTAIGYVGGSYSWSSSKILNNKVTDSDGNADWTGKLKSSQHDLGLFWRLPLGGFYAFARLGGGTFSINSSRTFTGTVSDTSFTRTATGSWDGWYAAGSGGMSYAVDLGSNFSLKPMVTLDYFRVKENGYEESGGGDAVNLTVSDRTSDSLAVTGTVTAIYRFGRVTRDGWPLTLELEGGHRAIVGGQLGDTTAYFTTDDTANAPFSIAGTKPLNSWVGEARVLAGGWDFTWQLTGRAEKTDSGSNYSLRAGFSIAF